MLFSSFIAGITSVTLGDSGRRGEGMSGSPDCLDSGGVQFDSHDFCRRVMNVAHGLVSETSWLGHRDIAASLHL